MLEGHLNNQINKVSKFILKEIQEKENEPQYLHEDEDWINGLIMAEEIIDKFIKG